VRVGSSIDLFPTPRFHTILAVSCAPQSPLISQRFLAFFANLGESLRVFVLVFATAASANRR